LFILIIYFIKKIYTAGRAEEGSDSQRAGGQEQSLLQGAQAESHHPGAVHLHTVVSPIIDPDFFSLCVSSSQE
jgi:hypothetical protein